MMIIKKSALFFVLMITSQLTTNAQYVETMKENGLSINLKKEYNIKNDRGRRNQSQKLQKAIDDLAKKGGGKLILPKGTYSFGNIRFKSNVHLLIEKKTVIKPYWPKSEKACIFYLSPPKSRGRKDERKFIENVSIRGLNGQFTIDYSDRKTDSTEGIRSVVARMVNNFLISDMEIKDNYTTYCGMTLTPTNTKRNVSSENWPISRPTNGLIKNCKITKASPGYGLVQLHGAQTVHFEDLYAEGGVTLRLETGAGDPNTGVFDVTAKNIVNENGRCALMLGPHSATNGLVKVDGVKSIGSCYAVQIGQGGVKASALKKNPHAQPGTFAKGTSVKNIHAIFGETAQVKKHAMLRMPEAYYSKMKIWNDNKFFDAPSIAAVIDASDDVYDVIVENVTYEGFTYNNEKAIFTPKDDRPGSWGAEVKNWMKSNKEKDPDMWRVDKGFPKKERDKKVRKSGKEKKKN